jgi:tetratricopeptide (TPR) repeat protein
MLRLLVAAALLAACRGGKPPARKDAGPTGPALSVSVVPKLPLSPDGDAELATLDASIESATDPRTRVVLLLQRAAIRGRLDDYVAAVTAAESLGDSNADALDARVQALLRVHRFADARALLAKLSSLVHPSRLVAHEIVLAEAAGDRARGIAMRAELALQFPSPAHLTAWAAALAHAGRADEAIAIIPEAAAAVRDNPAQLLAWLLFQWGRCYEQAGEAAAARELFAAAHARLPGYVEATVHLADTMIATGDTAGARTLVDEALGRDRHPALLELAVRLGRSELAADAKAAWERYVAALPLAFADHAARFYLGAGAGPKRALELARVDLDNRPTLDARALVVEAALAAGDPEAACEVVDPVVAGGTRRQRFIAWRAVSACGRTADADRLARELGIVH